MMIDRRSSTAKKLLHRDAAGWKTGWHGLSGDGDAAAWADQAGA